MSRANQSSSSSSSHPPRADHSNPASSSSNDVDFESLLEMDQDMVKTILQNKMEVWMNKELSDLILDYFENILTVLDACTALQACLERASSSIISLQEIRASADPAIVDNFNPFTPDFLKAFNLVYKKQLSLLERLQKEKRKLDKEIWKIKAKRRVANIIFVVAVGSGMVAAAGLSLVSTGRWLRSILEKHDTDFRTKREMFMSMQVGSYVLLKDMDRIRVLIVDKYRIAIEALFGSADFGNNKEKEVDSVIKIIHELSESCNNCGEETRRIRALVLKGVIGHRPSTVLEVPQFVVAELVPGQFNNVFTSTTVQTNADHVH